MQREGVNEFAYLLWSAFVEGLGTLLGLALAWVPTNPNVWAFGAWHGRRFSDNSRWLLTDVLAHRPDIQAVWITRRWSIRQQVRRMGLDAYVWWEPLGLITTFRSGVVAYTHSVADIGPLTKANGLHVNLTHGTPLKRIWAAIPTDRKTPLFRTLSRVRAALLPPTHLVCAASEAAAERFRSALTKPCPVIATGYSRWAPLLSKEPSTPTESLTILYAPTHRSLGARGFDPSGLDGFTRFSEWARSQGHRLIFRPHQSGSERLPAGRGWIEVNPDRLPDTIELLPEVDVLITDYSSICYEFGVLSGRMAFLISDLDEYQNKDQGIFDGAFSDLAGPQLEDWNDALDWLIDGAAPSADYPRFRETFCSLADGEANTRIVAAIEQLQQTCRVTAAHEWTAATPRPAQPPAASR